VLNHDTLAPGATWPMHPHRDVEGISYIPAGTFEHGDSLGNGGVIEVGGVQRMTLGSGALHSESNHSKTEPVEFIQMWILPAVRGLTPSVEQRQHTLEDRRNRLLEVLRPAGTKGETGVTVHQDVHMYVSHLEAGAAVEHVFRPQRCGYFYLIDGATGVNGQSFEKGDAAYVTGDGVLAISASETSELLIVDTPL
jgi:redox-sensitive bicupin YhaK (pirin superfamily)